MTSMSKIWRQLTSILSNLNNFHLLEIVDRVSETQLQLGENFNWIIWLKGLNQSQTIAVHQPIIIYMAKHTMNAAEVRGFVKLKKKPKSEKNLEVGGWVRPQLGFLFFGDILCFFVWFYVVFMFPNVSKKIKNWIGGGVWPMRVFLRFF